MPDVTDRSWFANTATFERFQPFGRVRDNERSPKERVLLLVGLDTETAPLRVRHPYRTAAVSTIRILPPSLGGHIVERGAARQETAVR